MIRTTLKITFTLDGPLLTRDSGPAAFGFDAALARNNDGPCVPATLLKGRLREAMEELHAAAGGEFQPDLADLLGETRGRAELGETKSYEPMRGRLQFTDLALAVAAAPSSQRNPTRHRIEIAADLGSVKRGALFVAEDVFGSGKENITATGRITFLTADETKTTAGNIARQVEIALRWIPQFGAGRTTGFGRVRGVKIEPKHEAITIQQTNSAPAALALEIHPGAPFCFAQPKIGGNLFESQPFIPGNAIKGAIAEMLRALGKKPPAGFDAIRVRHAFPSAGDERARVAPLSIVAVKKENPETGKKDDVLYDVAAHPHAILIHDQAPAFCVDWKGSVFEKCNPKFGWKRPATTLRVRTAMDSATQKGKDGQLFSQEMISPEGTVWRGVIDLSAIADAAQRAKAAAELKALLEAGLRYLGKTKATARVNVVDAADASAGELGDTVRITLQTPALLGDPRFQEDSLHACYAAAWGELSRPKKNGQPDMDAPPTLTLSHFFASQSLAGGNYLWQRFQKDSPKPGYRPWFLTDAGSVFILKIENRAAATAKINEWLKGGLPLPGWAVAEFTDDWRHNPYIPQNGFGEIAVNITGDGIADYIKEDPAHV